MGDFEFSPLALPSSSAPVQTYFPPPEPRGGFQFLRKALAGPVARRRPPIEPRKGGSPVDISVYGQALPRKYLQQDSSPSFRGGVNSAPGYSLSALAERDDIIFSIRNTLQRAIGEMEWQIVPDLDNIKADLGRWQETVKLQLMYPSLPIDFQPIAIAPEFYFHALGELRDLLTQEFGSNIGEGVDFDPDTSMRLRNFFEHMLSYHKAIAEGHALLVKATLEKPNPSAESSFRSFLNRGIDDLTVFDAMCVVKNPRLDGTPGELYCVPGDLIRPYKCRDLSTPQPPYAAYDWFDAGQVRAVYNNAELIYVSMNPRKNGYGKSPIEVILEQMVAGFYADAYLSDGFQNNNMPPFVFDLGPNVSQAEKDAVEAEWDNRVRRGLHRGIFIGAKEGIKGFIPMQLASNKDQSVMELLKQWAVRKCAVYGLSLNDIGWTEDLHRTTAETQQELTQARGVISMAKCIGSYVNGEYLKGQFWLRDDPENPNCIEGHLAPCFPWRDVKFQFEVDESEAKLEDAQRATALIDAGVLTRNEVRKELKLPPREGGDVLTISAAIASLTGVEDLNDLADKQAAAAQQAGPPGADGKPGGADQPGAPKPPGGNDEGKPPQPPSPGGGRNPSTPPRPPEPHAEVAKRLESLRDNLVALLEK